MSKTFYIGFNKENFGSWCSVSRWPGLPVSSNARGFKLNNDYFECEFYISKESEVGKKLFEIVDMADEIALENFNNALAMEYLCYEDIIRIIKKRERKSYEDGYKQAQKDIRIALGIREW